MAAEGPGGPPRSLFAHHATLRDAATRGEIDSSTELVPHYDPEESDSDDDDDDYGAFRNPQKRANDRLLCDLTGLTNGSEPCSLVLGDGTVFPPKETSSACKMTIRFRDLWLAPAVFLECRWKSSASDADIENLKGSLVFHFNSMSPGRDGIQEDFSIEKDVNRDGRVADEMSFTCWEAACEGFNRVEKYRKEIGSRGMQIYDALFRLIKPTTPQKVRLRFQGRFREGHSLLGNLLRHLPGGAGWQLPSLHYGDWAPYLIDGFDCHDIRSPEQLMNGRVPHLMVTSPSSNTFATLEDASRELRYAAHYSYVVQRKSLELWAETRHIGQIHRVDDMAVMAIRFKPFEKLGSKTKEKKFSLPDGLFTKMFFTDFRGRVWTCSGKLFTASIQLPDNQGVFAITSHDAKAFKDIFFQPENKNTKWMDVRFEPHISKFTNSAQMETARRIVQSSTSRFDPIILNQLHSGLQDVDLLTGKRLAREESREDAKKNTHGAVQDESPAKNHQARQEGDQPEPQQSEQHNPSKAEKAFQRLLSLLKWNPEQVEALKSIRKARGGVVLISGPPGTGKTEVAQAISEILDANGCHVIVLAPQNANCTNWMRKLRKAFPHVNALRIFPGATEEDLKDVNESRAKHHKPGHDGRASTNVFDFDIVLARAALDALEKYTGLEDGLQLTVLKAAMEGTREFKGYLKDVTGRQIQSTPVNFWEVLRDCIVKSKDKKFNWNDDIEVQKYLHSYKMCKEQYVAQQKYVVTTTGNVRCSEITEYWARDLHGSKCDGIVIILDEACKDKEIDTLAMMLSREHISKIRGIIMLGDERQLEPTNTSSKQRMVFSTFPHRESISLFARLKAEGFPCTELKEQHRMNQCISRFIFENFYPEGMRNSPEMRIPLIKDEPVLFECLQQFIRDSSGKPALQLKGADLRTHYLQIKGVRKQEPDSGSSYVREHIQVFFNTIFWYLHAYYGKRMQENVMIIAAYGYALRLWKDASAAIQRQYKLSAKDIPSLRFVPECSTIDSSQGREANVVFLDCSVQDPNKLGFVDDDKRMNVACSRAKKVFWILGGDCSQGSRKVKTPAYIKYYNYLSRHGRVLDMKNSDIQQNGSSWMYELEKKDVKLVVHWRPETPNGGTRVADVAKGDGGVSDIQRITSAAAALSL